MSAAPGHDINYIAQTGVLNALRDERGKPQPPVNLVADFAGGGLLLSNGILAALFERTKSGKGLNWIYRLSVLRIDNRSSVGPCNVRGRFVCGGIFLGDGGPPFPLFSRDEYVGWSGALLSMLRNKG